MTNLTSSTKPASIKNIERAWHLIDIQEKILGRVAPDIVRLLMGKHKTQYVSYLDMGDNVVVVNSKKVAVTGRKAKQKVYTSYSGYPGGLKKIILGTLLDSNPSQVIRHAVSGMLPKNKLRDKRLARLFIFPDGRHPYEEKFEIINSK